MRPFRIAAALALLAAAAAARADPRPAMLPPEIASQFDPGHFDGFREPALWPPEARRGYRTRYRLTIAGIRLAKVSIRIDDYANGRLIGHLVFVERNGDGTPRTRTATRFRVTRPQLERLRDSARQTGLWTIHPQFYVPVSDEGICVDGMEIVFERVDADGYRFSNGNAPCTAPPGMRRAAAVMIEIAGAGRALPWVDLPR